MFCEKCGKQLPDGSAFCDACGAKMTADTENEQLPGKSEVVIEKKPFVLTKQHKIIGLAGIGVIVLAIIIAIIVSIAGKNVKLDKYFTVESKGYNGYGSVEYEFDQAALFERITGEDVSAYENVEDIESLSNAATLIADATAISSALSVDVAYPEGKSSGKLSNGDVVTYTLNFNESVAKKYGVKVKSVTVEHEVADLGEASVFDVLSNYGVTFSGYSGAGDAVITPTDTTKTVGGVTFEISSDNGTSVYYKDNENGYSGYFYIEFGTDNVSSLSNGDTVTLNVSGASADSLSKYGVILEGLSKEYTVEGLEEAETYDVLSNFDVIFTGVDGDGDAIISVTESSATVGSINFTTSEGNNRVYWEDSNNTYNDGYFYVYLDKSYDLSTGDTVKLTCDYSTDYLADYGVILTGMSKEYTVESLGKYATALADIGEDSLTALSEKYQEDLMNRLYDDWGDTVHNSWRTYKDQKISEDMALYKTIMTTPKNTSSSTNSNLWLVFSVTLSDDSMDEATKYYFYYNIEDVVVSADGVVDLEMDYDISKSDGYTDYNKIYDDKIESFNLNIEVAE